MDKLITLNYYILERESKDKLEEDVIAMSSIGWKPQGGVQVYYDVILKGTYYIQAMMKEV